jgi:hypothetical protein
MSDDIRAGDVVCLTPEAIRRAPRFMGPIKLYSIGWPNQFMVVHVFEHEGKKTLSIMGCCNHLIINRRTGAFLCTGHDAKWFRKIAVTPEVPKEAPRERRKGDRLTSIEAPLIGEVGALEFQDDEQNPALILRAFGQKITLTGKVALDARDLAKDNGLMG